MKTTLITSIIGVLALIVLVVIIAGALQDRNDVSLPGVNGTVTPTVTGQVDTDNAAPQTSQYNLSIEEQGFIPVILPVNAGDTVNFINATDAPKQIMSDPHPEHSQLLELNSGMIPPGGAYKFTFNQVGTFGFHEESNPNLQGTIIVE